MTAVINPRIKIWITGNADSASESDSKKIIASCPSMVDQKM